MGNFKTVCNAWYYLNGVRVCPIADSIGCRMTGDVECGLSKPEPSLTPTNGNLSAWECPRCHKINAFWVRQCDCPPLTTTANTVIIPGALG